MKPIGFIPLLFLLGSVLFSETTEMDSLYDPGELKPVDSRVSVRIGEMAPDFTLPTVGGGEVKLSDFRGKQHVILSFVPAAWTPVCSAQWPGYSLVKDEFGELDAVVLGITVDNVPTLHAWTEAMGGLNFPVLSDFFPHGAVSKRYGILRSDGTSERALFVVDKEGRLRFIDVHDINLRPPLEDLFRALESLQESNH